MRPDILFPLFAETTSLKGVGPKVAQLIERAAGARVIDLCLTLPTAFVDRSARPKVMEATVGSIATLDVVVDAHQGRAGKSGPTRVRCADETGYITLVFFHGRDDWIKSSLPVGERRIVSGRIEEFNGARQMAHPDYILLPERIAELPQHETIYPLTAGLSPKAMRKVAARAVAAAPDLPEWLDGPLKTQKGWRDWRDALARAHAPESLDDLDAHSPDRQRLAYDELLANQLALALVRRKRKAQAGRQLAGDGALRKRIETALPFALTGGQKRTLEEIYADLASEDRMTRLIHGDVGAGKTVVALLAMAAAVESGAQAAFMAPTALLARQHLKTLRDLSASAGLAIEILTGEDKGAARAEKLDRLKSGRIDILVGTHALFQEGVDFADLGLAVVDEQHRFGVRQRQTLLEKGDKTNLLIMTATPIPRTLALAHYGDLDVSKLDEKPAGRREIATRALPLERMGDVVERLRAAMSDGAQAYWVCPLVEESDLTDVAAAETRFAHLQSLFGDRVGLVHGRMAPAEKSAVMARFHGGEISILVATTVVEVGVDAPDATIMIVENAQQFGLAQLHQLRGRVGRGDRASTCLLLYQAPLGDIAKARLAIMRETNDGFRIAEEDLRLRGEGEFLGARQSGAPKFRIADLDRHRDLLEIANKDAALIAETNHKLEGARGEALRVLLYLFERDLALRRFLRSG